MKQLFSALIAIATCLPLAAQTNSNAVIIEDHSWIEARQLLTDTTIVVIPMGAQSKEHGPHLLLKNDFLIASYLRDRIAQDQDVVIYPTLNYGYYPAFLQYAGSTSLQLETAANMLIELCQLISTHGPRKIYILNTGVSTLNPLRIAAAKLNTMGILMTYTDILNIASAAEEKVKQEPEGTHADEIETSMMLYMAPQTVDMSKAAKDIPSVRKPGPLTPYPDGYGSYSPSGIYGDATLASREKGKVVVEAMVEGIKQEIKSLRMATPPGKAASPNLNLLTGKYADTNSRVLLRFILQQDHLVCKQDNHPDISLTFQGENAFNIGTIGRVVFFGGLTGNPESAYVYLSGKDYLLHRTSE